MIQHYIYGAGGHGKVVLDAMQSSNSSCIGFIDDNVIQLWAGLNVYHSSKLESKKMIHLHLAIGNCKSREALVSRFINSNFFTVKHPAAVIARTAVVGLGSFLAAQSIVAPNAEVGVHCIVNHSAVVDHDSIIGDYSHLAPQSTVGGGVKIGRGVLLGAGAIVLPGLIIDDYAVIGAGAVVTKNVLSGVTVVGNPAKPMVKR